MGPPISPSPSTKLGDLRGINEEIRIRSRPFAYKLRLQGSAMRRPRITIASLLGIVAFVGVASAALREPTEAWDSTLLGLTLLLLLTSVLFAVHRSGDRRAFWQGFALFGW